jgi:hypothetical protein
MLPPIRSLFLPPTLSLCIATLTRLTPSHSSLFPPCSDAMIELELACDGGKDSLSMAAAAGGETVMAPGNLVVSAYVGCPDVTKARGAGAQEGREAGRGRIPGPPPPPSGTPKQAPRAPASRPRP